MRRRLALMPELAIWLALLALLGLTLGLAYVPLGAANGPLGLTIAAVKAGVVIVFFMHVLRESPLIRLSSLVGLYCLLVFFLLTFSDYATRRG